MNKAHETLLSISISYFSEKKCSVVQHSQTFNVVHAKALFCYIKQVFTENQLPFTNLISNLYNSTNYMHGKNFGLKLYSVIKYLTYLILILTHATTCAMLQESFY